MEQAHKHNNKPNNHTVYITNTKTVNVKDLLFLKGTPWVSNYSPIVSCNDSADGRMGSIKPYFLLAQELLAQGGGSIYYYKYKV
jgi:hypothetical protein